MGFGGGGGGTLSNHVHNSVPLQGGPLDFANDTIASLNIGSTTFSDGAALQELVIGNPADTLVVNGAGNAPEWGAAGGGAWVSEGNAVSATATTSLSVDVGDADVYQILYHVADFGSLANCSIRINNETGDVYKSLVSFGTTTSGNMDVNAAGYATVLDNKWLLSSQKQDAGYSGVVYIYKYNSNFNLGAEAGHTFTSEGSSQQGTGAPGTAHPQLISVCSGGAETITADITNIKLQMILEGTTTVRTIAGSMRVNSLTYS